MFRVNVKCFDRLYNCSLTYSDVLCGYDAVRKYLTDFDNLDVEVKSVTIEEVDE